MATIANSVMLIGIVDSIDIDQEEGFITFSLTTNETIPQNDGSFDVEKNVFDCIAQEPLATKMTKEDLTGLKVVCQGRLISSRDSARQKTVRKWVFIEVEDFFKVER